MLVFFVQKNLSHKRYTVNGREFYTLLSILFNIQLSILVENVYVTL